METFSRMWRSKFWVVKMIIHNGARQIGKSTMIAKRLKEEPNTLVVVATHAHRNNFLVSQEIPEELHKRVIIVHELMRNPPESRKRRTALIFDELTICMERMFPQFKSIESYGTEVVNNLPTPPRCKFREEYLGEFVK